MKSVKFTARVVRGLQSLQELVDASLNEDSAPPATLVTKWTKAKRGDFNLAKDWIDQEVQKRAPAEAAVDSPAHLD